MTVTLLVSVQSGNRFATMHVIANRYARQDVMVESPARGQSSTGLRGFFTIDLPVGRAQPRIWGWIAATILALAGSLAGCAALVAIGEAVFPSTRGYEHFVFSDYARLTAVGVMVACIGWPITTFVSSRAWRLYLWLWIALTVVSFAPDVWIAVHGQNQEGVFILVLMHVVVFMVTYICMVTVARQPRA